jgi:hypothetical protein
LILRSSKEDQKHPVSFSPAIHDQNINIISSAGKPSEMQWYYKIWVFVESNTTSLFAPPLPLHRTIRRETPKKSRPRKVMISGVWLFFLIKHHHPFKPFPFYVSNSQIQEAKIKVRS